MDQKIPMGDLKFMGEFQIHLHTITYEKCNVLIPNQRAGARPAPTIFFDLYSSIIPKKHGIIHIAKNDHPNHYLPACYQYDLPGTPVNFFQALLPGYG